MEKYSNYILSYFGSSRCGMNMVSIAASSFWTRIIVGLQNNEADYGGLVEVEVSLISSPFGVLVLFYLETHFFTTQGIRHMRSGDEQMIK